MRYRLQPGVFPEQCAGGLAPAVGLAVTYAWTGEKAQALQTLKQAVAIPGDVSYGQLRLHPFWDPLRRDPEFEKVVASLAPKNQTAGAR